MKISFSLLLFSLAVLTLSGCTWDFDVCQKGETKCNGKLLMTCSNDGEWLQALDCGEKYFCYSSIGCVECLTETDCKDSTKPVCNESKKSCQAADAPCAWGQKQCNGNIFMTCNNDESAFESTTCAGNKPYCNPNIGCVECLTETDCKAPKKPICNAKTNTCGECNSNNDCSNQASNKRICNLKTNICRECVSSDNYCEDNIYRFCENGIWTLKSCERLEQVCDSTQGCVIPTINSYSFDFEDCVYEADNKGHCKTNETMLTFTNGEEVSSDMQDTKALKLHAKSTATVTAPHGIDGFSIFIMKNKLETLSFEIQINDKTVLNETDLSGQRQSVLFYEQKTSGPIRVEIIANSSMIIDNLKWNDFYR